MDAGGQAFRPRPRAFTAAQAKAQGAGRRSRPSLVFTESYEAATRQSILAGQLCSQTHHHEETASGKLERSLQMLSRGGPFKPGFGLEWETRAREFATAPSSCCRHPASHHVHILEKRAEIFSLQRPSSWRSAERRRGTTKDPCVYLPPARKPVISTERRVQAPPYIISPDGAGAETEPDAAIPSKNGCS